MSGRRGCDDPQVQPSGAQARPKVVTARLRLACALAVGTVTLAGCSSGRSSAALPPEPKTSAAPATGASTHAIAKTPSASRSARASLHPPHTTKTLGRVVSRTAVPHGYRIVLEPSKRLPNDTWVLIPGRPAVTYVIPHSLVPTASLLSGDIQVTTQGHRVTGVVIIGG